MREPSDTEFDAMREAMDLLEDEFDGCEVAVVVIRPVGTPGDERCSVLHANNLVEDDTAEVLRHALRHLNAEEETATTSKADAPS